MEVNMVYRTEYPRPQLQRDSYICLNGAWQFALDPGESLPERGLFDPEHYPLTITVPFCSESPLSGINNKDFMNAVAYRRTIAVPDLEGGRLLLHFGACDYETECYVGQTLAGRHIGGYSSFAFDITDAVPAPGDYVLTVYVRDHNRSGNQGRGKQSPAYFSQACDYTRTTGIWQTVWMERVPQTHITSLRLVPGLSAAQLVVEGELNRWDTGTVPVTVLFQGEAVAAATAAFSGRSFSLCIPIPDPQPWEPGTPNLYDLELRLTTDLGCSDQIRSYFGMRDISFAGNAFVLNGKKLFLRTVLDQGFYPDGIYTAPTDEALRNDILLSQQAGFNGARLHQKVFEERFLYHCDQLGYLVFEEYPDAGSNRDSAAIFLPIAAEWSECIVRDRSHPAIIGWCPYNETSVTRNPDLMRETYLLTRRLDPTRPVIDTSGYTHEITDIYDVHDYEQDPAVFARHMDGAATEACWKNNPEQEQYGGQPYFVSEYGGIWWSNSADDGWGYGKRPESLEEFYTRYEGLTKTLLNHPQICGFCYTQLTDIEQEQNGIYTFDRSPKFDVARIRAVNTLPAAIESTD